MTYKIGLPFSSSTRTSAFEGGFDLLSGVKCMRFPFNVYAPSPKYARVVWSTVPLASPLYVAAADAPPYRPLSVNTHWSATLADAVVHVPMIDFARIAGSGPAVQLLKFKLYKNSGHTSCRDSPKQALTSVSFDMPEMTAMCPCSFATKTKP